MPWQFWALCPHFLWDFFNIFIFIDIYMQLKKKAKIIKLWSIFLVYKIVCFSIIPFSYVKKRIFFCIIKKSLYLFYIINFIIYHSSVLHFKIHDVKINNFFSFSHRIFFIFFYCLSHTQITNQPIAVVHFLCLHFKSGAAHHFDN